MLCGVRISFIYMLVCYFTSDLSGKDDYGTHQLLKRRFKESHGLYSERKRLQTV